MTKQYTPEEQEAIEELIAAATQYTSCRDQGMVNAATVAYTERLYPAVVKVNQYRTKE